MTQYKTNIFAVTGSQEQLCVLQVQFPVCCCWSRTNVMEPERVQDLVSVQSCHLLPAGSELQRGSPHTQECFQHSFSTFLCVWTLIKTLLGLLLKIDISEYMILILIILHVFTLNLFIWCLYVMFCYLKQK